jgi:SAM-dependent methyltransferase
VLYDRIGVGYAGLRRPDPRVAAAIEDALGDARSVVNVGAGSGSYEPGATVLAVEPSAAMVAQRPEGAAPAVHGLAGALPVRDQAVDAALAVLTTHHWPDVAAGLAEMARVSRRQVILTFDLDVLTAGLWLFDYLPATVFRDAERTALQDVLACWPDAEVVTVPVPADCTDGFLAAYWRRPEAYLDENVRAAVSTFALLADDVLQPGLARLRADLADGTWQARYGGMLALDDFDCGYRLVVNG